MKQSLVDQGKTIANSLYKILMKDHQHLLKTSIKIDSKKRKKKQMDRKKKDRIPIFPDNTIRLYEMHQNQSNPTLIEINEFQKSSANPKKVFITKY